MAIKYDDLISVLKLTTQAPKTLSEAGITTVGQLLDRDRETIAGLSGMGASRLADVDRALEERGLAFGRPLFNPNVYQVCTTCSACLVCGLPRATEARQAVVDYRGRYKHANVPGEPCAGCNDHHRQLFAAAA
ncbi:MAG TPA: DNA-directed RNA polymerase subunit alpha C-terminal domain-containing protein [Streptomyces sp.]